MKGHKEKMNKKTMNFSNFFIPLCTGALPFVLHLLADFMLASPIIFINYSPEIYFFNVTLYVYDYMCSKRLFIKKICLFIFLLSTGVYSTSYLLPSKSYFLPSNLEPVFTCLVALTLLNLILTAIIVMTAQEINADRHEISSEIYSENRYERYLLERIDEKLNSIKTPKSDESEKEINDAKNSEELLNGSDILAEMLKNHIEIKEYFRISKNQSKFSFYFSIVSSVIGIIVIIIAAFGIKAFKEISIIAALSGAITEIISGIVLWIHNKSALQLNYYYDSLHENEKFLSAVNIADKLSEEKKEDMYIEIIRKQIDIQVKNKESRDNTAQLPSKEKRQAEEGQPLEKQ